MSVESEFGHGATFIIELPIIESLPSELILQLQIRLKYNPHKEKRQDIGG